MKRGMSAESFFILSNSILKITTKWLLIPAAPTPAKIDLLQKFHPKLDLNAFPI